MQGLGKNQWYEIKYDWTGGSLPTLDSYIGKPKLDKQIVTDNAVMNSFNADQFQSHMYTNVYLSQDKDIFMNYVSDNESSIYINNQLAYFQNTYVAGRGGVVNYIQNSDFQNGTKGWTLSPGMTLDTGRRMNTFSNSIKIDISGKTSDVWTPLYGNFISCVEGDKIATSAYIFTDDLTTDTGSNGWWMEVEWWDNTSSSRIGRTGVTSRINPTANNTWQRFQGVVTAPAGTTRCRLRIHPNQNGRFWVTQPQMEKSDTVTSYYPSILLSFKKGWNTIDITLNEGGGGQGYRFSSTLSTQVDDMGYYINDNDIIGGVPDRLKSLRESNHIMYPLAHGQITIADYTDVGTATAYISSSTSKTQVYDMDTGIYSPDWSTSNPVLTPSLFISKDTTNTDKITSAKSIKWYDSASPTTPLASAGDFSISSIATGGKLTIKNNVMSGTTTSKTYICEVVYTDPDTGFDIQLKAEYSFNRVKNGAKGDDVVFASTLLPDGSLFTNSIGRLSAKMEVYEAGTLTVPYSYEWFIRYPGSADEGIGVGWKLITDANQRDLGIEGIVTSSLIFITPDAVNNVTAFKVRVTHRGKTYFDSFTIYDTTDPVKLNITSSSGDIFKNGQIDTVLTANLIRNGQDLDVDGTEYFYKWSKYAVDGTKDVTFNKTGKSLTVTATDVLNKATFTVDVLQKVQSYGNNLLTQSGNFSTLNGWGKNGTAVLSLDTLDGFSVIKAVGGTGLSQSGQTKLSPNSEYIYSVEFMCNKDIALSTSQPLHMWLQVGDNVHTEQVTGIGGDVTEPNKWIRRWTRFTSPPEGGLFKGFIYQTPEDSTRIIWLKNAQLEEVGPNDRLPTPWSPNYKDEDAVVKGNWNFVPNSGPSQTKTGTLSWDTSLNGNVLASSVWSSGYNSGVPSPEIGYHAHINTTKFAYPVFEMINKNGQFGFKNRWMGVSGSLHGVGGMTANIKPGKRYTVSIEVMCDTVGAKINAGIYHYQVGSDTPVFANTQKDFSPCAVANTWEKKSFTFPIEDIFDPTRPYYLYLYGHQSAVEASSWIRNVKIEEGLNATTYTINPWDGLPMTIDEPNLTPNLIKDGSFANGGTGLTGFGGGATVVDNVFMGYKGLKKTVPASGYYDTIIDMLADPRKEYTLSFYAKGKFRAFAVPMKDTGNGWSPTSTEYHDNMLQVDSQSDFAPYVVTTKKTPTDTKRIRFIFRTEAGTNISTESYVTLIKVEEGTMATVWQPAIGE